MTLPYQMYKAKLGSPETTLAAAITASATSMTLADASVLPSAPNIAIIGDDTNVEIISYTGISGNTVSGLVRGVGDSVASAWNTGTTVARYVSSYDNDAFKENIEALETNKADLSNIRTHLVYYVKGTQTASTNAWTGNLPDVEALEEGMKIAYWLPVSTTSSSASLNLTLKNNVQTGAVPVFASGTTRLTSSHASASTILYLTYQTVGANTGWWKYADMNSTDISSLNYGSGNYVADSVIYRYQLLFQLDRNGDVVTPLNNVSNSQATTKIMLTEVEFDPFGLIGYWNSTSTINAGAAVAGGTIYYHRNFDARYTFNCGSTLTANKAFYLKCILQSNGKVKIAPDTCWTQDLPISNDGYVYIFLGRASSTTAITLYNDHPVYYHDGTEIRQLTIENTDVKAALATKANSANPSFTGTPTIEAASVSAWQTALGLADSGWQTLPLNTDNCEVSGNTPVYRKNGNIVFISGAVALKNPLSSGSIGIILSQALPNGYKPQMGFYIPTYAGTNMTGCWIDTNGILTLYNYTGQTITTSTRIYLNTIYMTA